MTNQLTIKQVEYHGVNMVACQREGGEILVSIKSICEGLGVAYASQYNRIKRDDTLSKGIFKMNTPSQGGYQETNMLIISFLPFFLTGIKSSMVKPEIRNKIIDFKLKAKDVLADAFLPKETSSLVPLVEVQRMLLSINEQMIQKLEEKRAEIRCLETEVFKHPLSEKERRVVSRIREDFKEEFIAAPDVFNIALDWVVESSIRDKKMFLEYADNSPFYKNYNISSFEESRSAGATGVQHFSNVRYSVKHTEGHAKFLLAAAFLFHYYGDPCIYQKREFFDRTTPIPQKSIRRDQQLSFSLNNIKFHASIGFREVNPCVFSYGYKSATRKEPMSIKDYLVSHDLGLAIAIKYIKETN